MERLCEVSISTQSIQQPPSNRRQRIINFNRNRVEINNNCCAGAGDMNIGWECSAKGIKHTPNLCSVHTSSPKWNGRSWRRRRSVIWKGFRNYFKRIIHLLRNGRNRFISVESEIIIFSLKCLWLYHVSRCSKGFSFKVVFAYSFKLFGLSIWFFNGKALKRFVIGNVDCREELISFDVDA